MAGIRQVISKMKKSKAPGKDKIPNEAWIHGSGENIKEIHRILTQVWKGSVKFPEE